MHLSPNEVQRLIAAAKAGSKESLGVLLERSRPYLNKQARRRLDPGLKVKMDEAELVQETLLAA